MARGRDALHLAMATTSFYFGITVGEDDRELLSLGASFPCGLAVHNSGMVALNDLIFVDMVPAGTTFKSAWFTDPWLQTNAVIFYSTVDTGDVSAPPAYGPANAPADIDVDGGDFWSTELPEPADVKWVAFISPPLIPVFLSPARPAGSMARRAPQSATST